MIKKQCERDEAFAWSVLEQAPYAVLAMSDRTGEPYCIPVSPVRHGNAVYFHCALRGRKLDLLRENPRVSMTAVSRWTVDSPGYTMHYASAVLQGRACLVEDDGEFRDALHWISARYSGADLDKFDAMMEHYGKATRVIRVDVDSITGKEN